MFEIHPAGPRSSLLLASTHSPAFKQFSSLQPLCSILVSFQGDLPFLASPSGHQPGISWGASLSGHPHPLIRAKKYNQESISSGSILCTFQPGNFSFLPGNSDLNFAFLFCTHEELMLMRELRFITLQSCKHNRIRRCLIWAYFSCVLSPGWHRPSQFSFEQRVERKGVWNLEWIPEWIPEWNLESDSRSTSLNRLTSLSLETLLRKWGSGWPPPPLHGNVAFVRLTLWSPGS